MDPKHRAESLQHKIYNEAKKACERKKKKDEKPPEEILSIRTLLYAL